MWDFQTVEKVISADNTKIHPRLTFEVEHLADAAFLVALVGEKAFLEQIMNFLLKPYYMLSLGKRDCSPSFPIFWGLVEDPPEVAFDIASRDITAFKQS